MGKLFKLALEEAVVEEPSIVEDVPVEEAVANAEELAKTDSEIQQDIAAVEELVEEKTKLEEQAMTNDELLSNPDAVVTATDVEVSEETRTEVQYSLGYISSMGKIRLSQESIANDVRSNPRKYLAISNEDIKDTIKKIWEKIKAFFRKIWDKIKQFLSKIGVYKKIEKNKINDLKKEVAELKKDPSKKNVKIKIAEINKNDNISTEAVLENSYINSLYTTCPYLVTIFGFKNELVRITTPESYQKSLDAIHAVYSKLIKDLANNIAPVSSEDFAKYVDNALENIEKNSVFVTIDRDLSAHNAVKEAVEDHRNFDFILTVNNSRIKYFNSSDVDNANRFVAKTARFIPFEAVRETVYKTWAYEKDFGLEEVSEMIYMLEKTGSHLDTAFVSAKSKHETLISEFEKTLNRIGGETEKYGKALMRGFENIASPEVVAEYANDLIVFRKEVLKVLKDILNTIKYKR